MAFLGLLVEQGHGHIVNTASTAGLFAYAYERLPYSATKAGVIALSEALALYLRPLGVGITCLCPGPVATNIGQAVTLSGPPVRMRGPGPDLVPLDPEVVGDQVVDRHSRQPVPAPDPPGPSRRPGGPGPGSRSVFDRSDGPDRRGRLRTLMAPSAH